VQSNSETTRNWPLRLSGIFATVFVGNVFLGKTAVLMGWGSVGIGDVAEFLTLLAAAATFIIAVLIKEEERKSASSDQT